MSTAQGVQSFSVSDVDQAMEIGTTSFYRHRVEPLHAPRSFVADFAVGSIGDIMAGILGYSCEVAGAGGGIAGGYGVHLPLAGRIDLRYDGEDIAATPDTAVLMDLAQETRFHGWAEGGERLFMLKFEQGALESELRRMLGSDLARPLVLPSLLDLRSGPGAQWAQFAHPIADALGSEDGPAWNPLLAAQLSSVLMTSLLLAADHNHRDDLDAGSRPTRPAIIRRAAAYIEEHAHEPITIPMVASAVGYTMRTLQRGFDEHLDMTPVAYLRKVRLDRVHHDLVSGTPESTSVAEIASRWGFGHLGYFAANYRAAYGKLPSATLRGR